MDVLSVPVSFPLLPLGVGTFRIFDKSDVTYVTFYVSDRYKNKYVARSSTCFGHQKVTRQSNKPTV